MDNPPTAQENDTSLVARVIAAILFNGPTVIPFIPTYLHLIVAAVLPIYTGAHASLKRPANTLSPAQVRKSRNGQETDDDLLEDDEDEDDEASASPIENLTATDALMFPVTAGVVLGGLFLIIKFLNDPSILSRIMTWYFSVMGVFAVGKTTSDLLSISISYIFPWRFRSADGKIYVAGYNSYKAKDSDSKKENPCGRLCFLPKSLWGPTWALRRTLGMRWCLVVKSKGWSQHIKKRFWVGDLVGLVSGLMVVGAYALGGKHWILSNIMGVSFSYGAVQLISPTTFQTGSILLGALFFYDIFFVFYTPLMVTVATNLDVPIKLLFPRPGVTKDGKAALAMLGLGDIVIPGLVVTMALRWDLWRFYESKRRANLERMEKSAVDEIADSDGHDIKRRKTMSEEELVLLTKPRYVKVTGIFGERFWGGVEGTTFGKEYFWSSIYGYIAGMIATLMVMHVFKHAQPALLYLVPGVLGSIWGTAAYRGELGLMWHYTEEGDPLPETTEPEKKADENPFKEKKTFEAKEETTDDNENDDDKSTKSTKSSGSSQSTKCEEAPKQEKEEEDEEEEWISVSVTKKPAVGARRRKMKGKGMEVPASIADESELLSSSSTSSSAEAEAEA